MSGWLLYPALLAVGGPLYLAAQAQKVLASWLVRSRLAWTLLVIPGAAAG